ncbi:cobyrinic acid a,c-diamide synthase (plasmid) [Sutcliffiella horikoshii]|uniref:Cobyrinic acid a,c-diamide synthase n=1 Tax=Sutcliffiella horikoshii TaxID=79883 RepID=A0ABN4ZNZ7_9BACI|nr:ParA family protein [Sutcliffiella horikoshii]ART78723.1 cobyrinic acid a,c-diamide synthase [Sutcliffiella horikoshii]
MAVTITMGIQKGGCGKSTTTGILAYLISQKGYKVLAIDMDSQGNLTELLSEQPSNDFMGKSVLEAMQQNNVEEFIVPINGNLDLLPANNFLATFPRWIYTGKTYNGSTIPFKGNPSLILDQTLDSVRDKYDFIVIDTPPSLSEQTTNSLCASEYVVVLFECSNWCYSAIPNFMDSVNGAQEFGNRGTEVLGILRTMNDVRRSDAKAFNELIAEDYPEQIFETIITRKAPTGRLSLYGFNSNNELKSALAQYENFYEELMSRVQSK